MSPIFDPHDRLTGYGGITYTYGGTGELQRKTDASGTTGCTYDSFGNLRNVTPPAGSAVDYLTDGMNRRAGRKLGGTMAQELLYGNQLNAVAELDGAGNLVAQYVYGTKGNVPDVKTDGTGTYRILSDHLGSPRLVVNTADGTVVEGMEFDEWGKVTADTSPSTTPFGFAGGLYEASTELVRFGMRDYDAVTGRWVSKDPIRFDGGQINIYAYVDNDPVNDVDSDGDALRTCAAAIDNLVNATARLVQRQVEDTSPDKGHVNALNHAKNAVQNALNQVARNCTAGDLVVIGAAASAAIEAAATAVALSPVGI